MKVNPDGQAFAVACENGKAFTTEWETGISTRTYIATAVMAGYRASDLSREPPGKIASFAVQDADALIAALNAETASDAVEDPVAIAAIKLLNELDGWSQEALDEAGGVTNTKALQIAMDRLHKALYQKAGVP